MGDGAARQFSCLLRPPGVALTPDGESCAVEPTLSFDAATNVDVGREFSDPHAHLLDAFTDPTHLSILNCSDEAFTLHTLRRNVFAKLSQRFQRRGALWAHLFARSVVIPNA